ncbi:MAG: glycoside hydrolase family 13 protein [Oscillospiraceae bacterium]|nr:glycoside hydrolase family 13 protein [Oscillospiraceae bacterium]
MSLLSHIPAGAVPSGSFMTFTLRPLRAEGFSAAQLTLAFEQAENRLVTLPLPWAGLDGDRDCFSAEVQLPEDYCGLVWCSAVLTGLDGRKRREGRIQLTVYDGGAVSPSWFGEGVTYQIFPDRFFRTAVPDPTGMVGGRTVHQSWDDAPDWRPDERGEVRNRDFFGGSLRGVMEKLPYLEALGVETLYLCPIFEGAENHRYGTGDYEKVDPMLGTNEDFSALCAAAHRRGMRVLLDGVFNHTGYVSRYFNGDGSYPDLGAAQSKDSPYFDWFRFTHWPDKYESWWGVYSLPAVDESCPSYRHYIFGGENSIVRRWLRAGADGWRLDVADELPDDFIAALRTAVRTEKADAILIGEVWEDGSNKVAYGVRRAHLWGNCFDGLMNYPFRTALLAALSAGDWSLFRQEMETLLEHYPPFAVHNAMNFLGTHDTWRILTQLGALSADIPEDKESRSAFRLPQEAARNAEALLKIAAAVLYAFPGSPMLYYGDELGLQGCEDPFNRAPFPWDVPRGALWDWFAALGALRKTCPSLRRGTLAFHAAHGPLLLFSRSLEGQTIFCAANLSEGAQAVPLPDGVNDLRPLLGDGLLTDGSILLPARSASLFLCEMEEDG